MADGSLVIQVRRRGADNGTKATRSERDLRLEE